MTTKAVIFDLDDTLMAEGPAYRTCFLETCRTAHEHYQIEPEELLEALGRHAELLWRKSGLIEYCREMGIIWSEGLWGTFEGDQPNLRSLAEWVPAYRVEAWSKALADHGVVDLLLAEELADDFIRRRRERHELFSEALEVLDHCRSKYSLAMVTNGAPDIQMAKVRAARLEPYFKSILISGEVGVGKPDPRIFRMALEQLGVGPEEAVMVGNSLQRDIRGAKNTGIRAIWMQLDGVKPDDDVEPDARITNLSQLPALL